MTKISKSFLFNTVRNPTITVDAILTEPEMEKAIDLYDSLGAMKQNFAKKCSEEIIKPVLTRINKTTNQRNDPMYLAYCVEYCLMKSRGNLHA